MSRTLKDSRAQKEYRKANSQEPTKRKYRNAKRSGFFTRLCEDDFCPECGGLTNFQNGFLTCTECNWSTFETEELNFGAFELKPAI